MTEQPPNEEQAQGDAAAETPAKPAAERPARHGPPVEVAEEVLDERGEETAAMLKKVLGSMAVESGGREDTPWARVEPRDLHAAVMKCRDGELRTDMLHLELAVDWIERIQMIYILYSTALNRKVMLRTDLPAESAEVDTVTDLWEAASWYERETHDLFGVNFLGNDDLEPLLLYEGFEGHPGLKSYPLHEYEEW